MFELVSHEPVVSEELMGESEDERVRAGHTYFSIFPEACCVSSRRKKVR